MSGLTAEVHLTGARLADGRAVEVWLRDGLIDRIETAPHQGGPSPEAGAPSPDRRASLDVDLSGYLLLPSFAEPHAHLDKALSAELVPNPRGDLAGAIDVWIAARRHFEVDAIADRARAAALRLISRGTTVIRSHVDLGPGIGLRAVEALLAVRAEVSAWADLQIVACAPVPLTTDQGAEARGLLDAALELGADAVGGAPWLDPDPAGGVRILADVALSHGVPLDLHVDETLDPAHLSIEHLLDLAESGYPLPITAGHAVSLGVQHPTRQQGLAERIAATGVGVVVLPVTNLYLQARGQSTAPPRGLAPAAALLRAGALVAGGGDNVRDPFNLVGRADPLEIASLLVSAAHLTPAQALDLVTSGARRVIGAEPVQLAAGSPADLVAVRAETLGEAIAFAPEDRVVFRRGRQIVQTRSSTTWADDPVGTVNPRHAHRSEQS